MHKLAIWKNQHSEFAIGLRSLVFWGRFQLIMKEVYTDSEEPVGALFRQADVGRPVKIDKSSQGQSTGVAEGAVRKVKDAVAALHTSWGEQGVDRLTQKKNRIKNKMIVSL